VSVQLLSFPRPSILTSTWVCPSLPCILCPSLPLSFTPINFSIHLGMSFTAMHWLRQKPCNITSGLHMTQAHGSELAAFAKQAEEVRLVLLLRECQALLAYVRCSLSRWWCFLKSSGVWLMHFIESDHRLSCKDFHPCHKCNDASKYSK